MPHCSPTGRATWQSRCVWRWVPASSKRSRAIQMKKLPSKYKKPRICRSRKKTAKKIRKAVGKQLRYLTRNLAAIEEKLALGRSLSQRKAARLAAIRTLCEQQKYMYDHRCHTVPDRIVSVSQPFLRPIVRGKAGKPVEFGAKLDISVVNGWTRLECFSFNAYNVGILPHARSTQGGAVASLLFEWSFLQP